LASRRALFNPLPQSGDRLVDLVKILESGGHPEKHFLVIRRSHPLCCADRLDRAIRIR
jgi:hypothetical protein